MFGDLKMSLACIVSAFGSRRGRGEIKRAIFIEEASGDSVWEIAILDDVFPTSCKE